MAFAVKEIYYSQTFTVPAGVTTLFYEFREDRRTRFMQANPNGAAYYLRSTAQLSLAGGQTNADPTLGDNSTTSRSLPVYNARPSENIHRIYGEGGPGYFITKGDYYVGAWGRNTGGQLGDGTITTKSSPVIVTFPGTGNNYGVHALSANGLSVLAVGRDGNLYGWGRNTSGQLADQTATNRSAPVQALGGYSWLKAQVAGQACAGLQSDGSLMAWGGGVPDGIGTPRSSPVQILSQNRFIEVQGHAASDQTKGLWVAIDRSRQAYTWGTAALGDGTPSTLNQNYSPQAISIPEPVERVEFHRVSSGSVGGAALTRNGNVYSWGDNSFGQIGDGTTSDAYTPKLLLGGHKFVDLFGGEQNVVGLKANGSLWYWGMNPVTGQAQTSPVQLQPATSTNFISAYTNGQTIWGLSTSGQIFAIGQNSSGYLGQNSTATQTTFDVMTALSTMGPFGESSIVKCAYGTDNDVFTGQMEVLPGQVISIRLGSQPAIQGTAIDHQLFLAPTASGFNTITPFARVCKLGWME